MSGDCCRTLCCPVKIAHKYGQFFHSLFVFLGSWFKVVQSVNTIIFLSFMILIPTFMS